MKSISFIVLFVLSFTTYSQIKSGIIVYTSSYTVDIDPELDIDPYKGPEAEEINNQVFTYTTQFNENYFRSKSGVGTNDYQVLIDRKTGGMVYVMTSDISKTVQFIDLTKSMKQMEEMNDYDDFDPYSYEDEENEENDSPGYHEDFYQELLRMKPKDTVIIRTGETKEILGYNCKKVILKIKGNLTETVWYTEELPELNDLSKIHSSIKGIALSVHTESSGLYSSQTDVTELKATPDELSGDQKLEVPEGYILDIGTIYTNNGEIEPYSSPYSSLPDFISFQDKEKLSEQIHVELKKAMKASESKEEPYYYFYFNLEIFMNENGKISEIIQKDESAVLSEKKMNAILKKLKKTIAIQPVTIYGKPIPFKLELSYSGSSEVGPAQYYDGE